MKKFTKLSKPERAKRELTTNILTDFEMYYSWVLLGKIILNLEMATITKSIFEKRATLKWYFVKTIYNINDEWLHFEAWAFKSIKGTLF